MSTFATFEARSARGEEIDHAIRRDGVCVIRGFVDAADLSALRAEAAGLPATREPWLVHHNSSSGFFVSWAPVVVRKESREGRVSHIATAFAHPLVAQVCRRYLGAGWFRERVIVDRKDAGPEPITGWHADQFERRGRCLKFMIYLDGTGPDNGAFSYVPGSHRVIDTIVSHASQANLDNRAVHTYEEIQTIAGGAGGGVTRLLEEVSAHVRSSDDSDNFYSISAPAGSVVVFDANGIHRGGVVDQGHRFVIRCHCRGVQLRNLVSSRAAAYMFVERLYWRWKAPAGAPDLI
jgi:hypothetical protein